MIASLCSKVAEYMNQTSNMESWQDLRKSYFEYSYLMFLSMCAQRRKNACDASEVKQLIYEMVEPELVSYVFDLPQAIEFTAEIIKIIKEKPEFDINSLYQEYLARDFMLVDGSVVFEGGKNSRDILGSYYTQEEFAYEITKKAMDDYLSDKAPSGNIRLKIADYACGGGAFLLSACKLCQRKNISAEIYGYDVDPIAVMITRFRLMNETDIELKYIHISLGNPLLQPIKGTAPIDKFKLAELGKFYGHGMGIIPEPDMSIIVGNPPWEKIRFEEKKFLHHYAPIERIDTKTERESYLRKLSEENQSFYNSFYSDYEEAKKHIRKDIRFRNSCCGELNTYALFTELCRSLSCKDGVVGLIVKSSLVKMPVYSRFFQDMTKNKDLYEIYMFVNQKKIFAIDSREEFSVIYLKKGNNTNLKLALNLTAYKDFTRSEKLELSYGLLNQLNPDTGMIPNITNYAELQFLTSVYEKHPVFGAIYPECKFGRLVHLTSHSTSIKKRKEDGYEPIYEGKFIELYTGKYATFSGMKEREKYQNKATARNIEDIDGKEYPEARFFIKQEIWHNLSKNFDDSYILAWRSLTSATNRRTMLATVLPLIPTCQSIQILQLPKEELLHVLAVFNSVVFDYITRLKMAGLDLTQTMIKQIPMPDIAEFQKEILFTDRSARVETHINSRIRALYRSDERLEHLFDDMDTYDVEKSKSRKQIVAELDKLIAFVYGIDTITLKKIVGSFEKYYTKEEAKKWF